MGNTIQPVKKILIIDDLLKPCTLLHEQVLHPHQNIVYCRRNSFLFEASDLHFYAIFQLQSRFWHWI